VLLALATADLSTTPAFAAARAWLAGNPGERWEAHWPRAASAFMQRA
jgi:hypothetical protein